MVSLAQTVLTKLMLARHLFHLAEQESRSHQDISLFAAVNLMQDAVEAFLLALAEHFNASLETRAEFATYIDKINGKLKVAGLAITELPFRSQLISLNKVRVLSKHQGVQPDRKGVLQRAVDCREFFAVATQEIFQRAFWSLSLVDFVDSGEEKDILVAAQSAFDQRDFRTCLEECRKVIYLEIEKDYNVKPYESETPPGLGLLSFHLCKSSYYKQNKKWIAENVNEPCDYIQLDYAEVDRELLKDGIDTSVFWNIWRLTPSVFREKEKAEWTVRYEPTKVEADDVEDCAEYVLEHTTELALRRQERRRSVRSRSYGNQYVSLKREGVPLYARASKRSAINGTTPLGITKLDIWSGTPAIDGDGYFWHIGQFDANAGFLSGYVDNDDIE